MWRQLAIIGASLAGLSVVTGAFGAHGLEKVAAEWPAESRQKRLDNWETAAEYQMAHGLAILVVTGFGWAASARRSTRLLAAAGWAFVFGTVLFSGSLYLYTLTGISKFGAVTPLGGLCWIVAWTLLSIALARYAPSSDLPASPDVLPMPDNAAEASRDTQI